MTKNSKEIYKDGGEGDSQSSLEFAQKHLRDLSLATSLKAKFKADAKGEWNTYNVRFVTSVGQEFWMSGLNIGYKGTGPTTLVKVLKLIEWDINQEVIFINQELQIARELPPKDKKKKDKKKDE